MNENDLARILRLIGAAVSRIEEEIGANQWTHFAECKECDNIRFFDNPNIPNSLAICPCPSCGEFSIITEIEYETDEPEEQEEQEEQEETPINPMAANFYENLLLKTQSFRFNPNSPGGIEWGYKPDGEETQEDYVKRLYKEAANLAKLPLSFFPEEEMIVLIGMIRRMMGEVFNISTKDLPHFRAYADEDLEKVCDLIKRALDDYQEHNREKLKEQPSE